MLGKVTKTAVQLGYDMDNNPVYVVNVWVERKKPIGGFEYMQKRRYSFSNVKMYCLDGGKIMSEYYVTSPLLAQTMSQEADQLKYIGFLFRIKQDRVFEAIADCEGRLEDNAGAPYSLDGYGHIVDLRKFLTAQEYEFNTWQISWITDRVAMHLTGLDPDDYFDGIAAGLSIEDMIA